MKRQRRKQEKLVLKMLPKAIVQRVMSGETAAETFDQATLYFSFVDGFVNVSKKCEYVSINWRDSFYSLKFYKNE